MSITLTIEFGGGLEILFGGEKSQKVPIPLTAGQEALPLSSLLQFMKEEMLEERPELFLQGETVRPGILVVINETDYELLGGDNAELNNEDTIVFISTLHGG